MPAPQAAGPTSRGTAGFTAAALRTPHSSHPPNTPLALKKCVHPTPHLYPGCPGFHWCFPRGEVRAAADSAAWSSAHTGHVLHPSAPPAFALVFPQTRERPAPPTPRAVPCPARTARGDTRVRVAQHGGQGVTAWPRTAEPPRHREAHGRSSFPRPGNTPPARSSASRPADLRGPPTTHPAVRLCHTPLLQPPTQA